jgi:hypothetical protein
MNMPDDEKYLTPEEVSARYSGRITLKTLENWRALEGTGPEFAKMGDGIVYPLSAIVAWERRRVLKPAQTV